MEKVKHPYTAYLRHQASKLNSPDHGWIREHDTKYRDILRRRLSDNPALLALGRGASVLCLGARLGGEVRAFLDIGFFAVGVDINPGRKNRFVLYGDFHRLQFPDDSADVVFMNCLDHALHFEALLFEIRRVLRPGGLLILEIVAGTAKGWTPDEWDVCRWETVDEMVRAFGEDGFKVLTRKDIDFPWEGEHITLRRLE